MKRIVIGYAPAEVNGDNRSGSVSHVIGELLIVHFVGIGGNIDEDRRCANMTDGRSGSRVGVGARNYLVALADAQQS